VNVEARVKLTSKAPQSGRPTSSAGETCTRLPAASVFVISDRSGKIEPLVSSRP